MPPVAVMYTQLPTAPADFAELSQIFYRYVVCPMDEFHHKLTQFISQKSSSDSAKQAAQAMQLELQQQTSRAQTHWEKAGCNTNTPLFLKCLQIETLFQTAQFSAINRLIKTLPAIRQTDESEALLYLAQTAAICGLPSVAMRLIPVLPESQHKDELVWVIRILQHEHLQDAQLENRFLAAKDWLVQHGITIACCGLSYSIIDDWLLDLAIYIIEPDMEKLVQTNMDLDNYLLDIFPGRLPAGICIHLHSIQELN